MSVVTELENLIPSRCELKATKFYFRESRLIPRNNFHVCRRNQKISDNKTYLLKNQNKFVHLQISRTGFC